MEIIETIPIYGMPNWVGILLLSSIGLTILTVLFALNTKYIGAIMALISAIGIIISIIGATTLSKAEFKYNEYVVRITNMPAQEFIEKYEVVKHFDYSDVIQVKEIEKK